MKTKEEATSGLGSGGRGSPIRSLSESVDFLWRPDRDGERLRALFLQQVKTGACKWDVDPFGDLRSYGDPHTPNKYDDPREAIDAAIESWKRPKPLEFVDIKLGERFRVGDSLRIRKPLFYVGPRAFNNVELGTGSFHWTGDKVIVEREK